MTAKKGIGIIGYGGFGEFLRQAWDQMEQAHVVAVCDSDASRDPGGVPFYTAIVDLLADENVDIVSIATPPDTHKDLAIQAMQAEKHVLVEKPLALTEKDGLLIKRVAESTDRVATVNFMLRFDPIVEALREIARSEVFGKLRRADLRNYATQESVPEGHWFWDPAQSGRILVEHGVHFFDLAGWVIGSEARDIFSLGVERKPGIEDRVFAAVTYGDGTVGTYWHSFTRPRELETTKFHFAFDLGEVDVFGWIPLELKIWGWTNERGLAKLKALGAEIDARDIGPRTAGATGLDYEVGYEVNAVIKLDKPKSEVYSDLLRDIMTDLIRAIDEPGHVMRVTLDDGIEAVRIAQRATEFAHPA
jgi:predicted dehydrogenase